MLTADLVAVRRSKAELKLIAIDEKKRARIVTLASYYWGVAHSHVGFTRDEFDNAASRMIVAAADRKLALGVRKLVVDRMVFESEPETDPSEVRREVFVAAAAARKVAGNAGRFDRDHVLRALASARNIQPEALEALLYADLKGSQTILEAPTDSAEVIAAGYELARVQAILLRAVRVRVEVSCSSPGAYRALFRKLKFHRLLHRIAKSRERGESGYVVEIDGPFSLFESVTKYGLNLALAFPAITECESWSLEAEVRWGKERRPLVFRTDAKAMGVQRTVTKTPALPDEVAALVEQIRVLDTEWKVAPAHRILDLPGVGLTVPDLEFTRGNERVYLEVLGYWSRDAVWKRIELVEKGLGEPIVFAFSKRLRVNEDVLDENLPAALYSYKGTMNARAVLSKVEAALPRTS